MPTGLLDISLVNDEPAYLVLWRGYPRSDATWQPRSQLLEDVPDIVAAYDRAHPDSLKEVLRQQAKAAARRGTMQQSTQAAGPVTSDSAGTRRVSARLASHPKGGRVAA